jgi:hypothetical protein
MTWLAGLAFAFLALGLGSEMMQYRPLMLWIMDARIVRLTNIAEVHYLV